MSAARKALDAQISEKDFAQQVITFAKLRGWLCYHTYRSTKSEPGFPDEVLVRGEFIIFTELKTEKGKMSAAQLKWFEALQAIPDGHVLAFVWRPSDWQLIERILT